MIDDIVIRPSKITLKKQRRGLSNGCSLPQTEIGTESDITYHTTHKECQEAIKIIDALLKGKDKMTLTNNKLKALLTNEKSKVSQLEQELLKLNEKTLFTNKSAHSILNTTNEEIVKLKAKVAELTQSNVNLNEDNLKLKEKITDCERRLREMPQPKIEITGTNSLLKELIRLKKEIESTSSHKQTQYALDQTIYTLETENKALKSQIAELRLQKILLEKRSQSLASSVKMNTKHHVLLTQPYDKENNINSVKSSQAVKKQPEAQENNANDFFESFFTNEEKTALNQVFSNETLGKYALFKKKVNCLIKSRNSVEQKYKYEIKQLQEKLIDLNNQIDFLNNKNKAVEMKYKLLSQGHK